MSRRLVIGKTFGYVRALEMHAKRKKIYKKTSAGSDLFNELWNAAVALRGSIEPADYKRYVLPLIFLRFLSLRYEQRVSEINAEIADPQSDMFTPNEQLAREIREDPDNFKKKNVFLVPKEARWDEIVKIARTDDVKLRLDNIMALLEKTFPKLKGLLPPIYAGSNLDKESIASLINLFSRDVFRSEAGGVDMLGRVYEYFIGEFANSEGKRGGEYFTPLSIVRTLVAMLEPVEGKVFDPCCGAGGMFVQSDVFAHHSGKLSFFGQESKEFTFRLCRLNLFIHGIDGDIRPGNSYTNDQHADLKADYVLANPPFNDGSKGENGWGARFIAKDDARLRLPGETNPLPLAPRNANTMWLLHFLAHLKDQTTHEAGGTAGFVMARGELSNAEIARIAVRRALVEGDFVDCVVTLSGKLFTNTQIPCALVLLSKNRRGGHGYRARKNEILFIRGQISALSFRVRVGRSSFRREKFSASRMYIASSNTIVGPTLCRASAPSQLSILFANTVTRSRQGAMPARVMMAARMNHLRNVFQSCGRN
jgi:type I restriction enzyme M protein